VVFLNPDARLDGASIQRLIERVEVDGAGLAAPRTVTSAGRLVHSQRNFVGVGSIWAQVFFLHRLFPNRGWVDGIVRDPAVYERAERPQWVSGACMLLSRSVLETLGGFDERFFMYCEDRDLCRRVRGLGLEVVYEPGAAAVHDEGSSAPSWRMVPVLVRSQIAYVEKYFGGWRRIAARAGIALHEAVRVVFVRGGRAERAGHLRGLLAAVSVRRP
jgi:GT2 family glycosyltransferase